MLRFNGLVNQPIRQCTTASIAWERRRNFGTKCSRQWRCRRRCPNRRRWTARRWGGEGFLFRRRDVGGGDAGDFLPNTPDRRLPLGRNRKSAYPYVKGRCGNGLCPVSDAAALLGAVADERVPHANVDIRSPLGWPWTTTDKV